MFQKEGIPGFYRGCATNLLRTTPSAVITFTSYEMINRFLERVVPKDNGYPQGSSKPSELNKPQPKAKASGTDTSQSNMKASSIPLGNEEQLTRHWFSQLCSLHLISNLVHLIPFLSGFSIVQFYQNYPTNKDVSKRSCSQS